MSGIRVTAIWILPLLASCASSGLYYMSDGWCETHLQASAARCPEHQERMDKQRVAANQVSRAE